eukprot:g2902.t1
MEDGIFVKGMLTLTENEIATGMADSHRLAILALIQSDPEMYDFAIFVRPSDPASTKLVKAKSYATKGLDVHSKSSNWGPQSGFIPVDNFFNKKSGEPTNDRGIPNVNAKAHLHENDPFTIDTKLDKTQLRLNAEVYEEFKSSSPDVVHEVVCPAADPDDGEGCTGATAPTCFAVRRPKRYSPSKNVCVVFRLCPRPLVSADGSTQGIEYTVSYYYSPSTERTWPGVDDPSPLIDQCPTDIATAVVAASTQVDEASALKPTQTPHVTPVAGWYTPPVTPVAGSWYPLDVYAYNDSPMTGDMDVWAIVPHINTFKAFRRKYATLVGGGIPISFDGSTKDNMKSNANSNKERSKDVTSTLMFTANYKKSVAGGLSDATDFEYRMIDIINEAIMRAENDAAKVNALVSMSDPQARQKLDVPRVIMNHGCENKNFYFTQALDEKLVYLDRNSDPNAPDVLTADEVEGKLIELAQRGYLVTQNVRYLMNDPQISGKTFNEHLKSIDAMSPDDIQHARQNFNAQIDAIKTLSTNIDCATEQVTRKTMRSLTANTFATEDGRREVAAIITGFISRIYAFHESFSIRVSDFMGDVVPKRGTSDGSDDGLGSIKAGTVRAAVTKIRQQVPSAAHLKPSVATFRPTAAMKPPKGKLGPSAANLNPPVSTFKTTAAMKPSDRTLKPSVGPLAVPVDDALTEPVLEKYRTMLRGGVPKIVVKSRMQGDEEVAPATMENFDAFAETALAMPTRPNEAGASGVPIRAALMRDLEDSGRESQSHIVSLGQEIRDKLRCDMQLMTFLQNFYSCAIDSTTCEYFKCATRLYDVVDPRSLICSTTLI